jgi:sulfatase maturation enzyme AslB (radical SAM superfamily)
MYEARKVPPKIEIKEVKFGEKLEIDNVACSFKWDYPIVNLQSGHVRGCCRTPKQVITEEDIEKYGIDVIQNLPYEQDRRREKLLGITHVDCESCLRLEANKAKPPRTGLTRFVNEHLIRDRKMWPNRVGDVYQFHLDHVPQTAEELPYGHELLKSDKVDMLEIILGNTCDLKCTYCSIHYSSQWQAELLKFGDIKKEEIPQHFPAAPEKLEKVFWEWFYDVGRHSARNINILGGEPTYMPKFYDTMDKLIAAYEDLGKKDYRTELGILSNMNTRADLLDKFLSYLPRLTKHLYVRLQPSMETIGDRAEYIRQNLSWSTFERNIDTVLSRRDELGLNSNNFSMGFQAALNTFSVSTMPEFILWTQSKIEQHKFNLGLYPNLVSYPRHHNPHILPSEYARYFETANDLILQNAEKNDSNITLERSRGIWSPHAGSWTEYSKYFLSHEVKSMALSERSQFDIESRGHFYAFVEQMKVRRGTDFLKTFPDMTDFYFMCKQQFEETGTP